MPKVENVPEYFVEAHNLSKIYSSGKIEVAALRDINLAVKEGTFCGITGTSGSGKSTLMNLLGGLDTPTSGSIKVQGKVISELNSDELALYRRFEVGMIFQSFNLIASYSAMENVAFPLLFADVPKAERTRRAEELLEKVGLLARKNHRPSELSGGEQQRVAIARALINNPKLLLADEPTGNLDSKTSLQIVQTLSDLNKNHGLTIIMISHEEDLLNEFADDIIHLRDGKFVDNKEF
ncbi:MAG: ABC transporter ATP-binding protein [Sedimentisphaerales bacterium]|nr:ABC transporter ATP-binding protein [Sedimentisphaerales bacterium]